MTAKAFRFRCRSLELEVLDWKSVAPFSALILPSLTQGLVSNLAFYLFAADAISILSLLAVALRLPTYLIADVTFRKEITWLVCCHAKVCPLWKKSLS